MTELWHFSEDPGLSRFEPRDIHRERLVAPAPPQVAHEDRQPPAGHEHIEEAPVPSAQQRPKSRD